MHASRSLLIAIVATLAVPGAAAAQTPTPTPVVPTATPAPTTTPAPTPAPAPAAAGKLRVSVKAPHRNRAHKVGLKGDKVAVKGALKPAAAGQRVLVRLTHGRKTVKTRRVRTGADGRFAIALKLRATGRLAVRALHKASPQIRRARARSVRVVAFKPSLHFGSRGALLRLFQRGLARMSYPTSRTGVYDAATGRAVMAYRKVNRLSRTETPSAGIVRDVLAGEGAFKVRHPKAGHHVEADISRQVVVLVDGDRVYRVEPASSGAPATPTILGTFRFYSQTPGINSKGMVYSNYFIRGYAIHGYASVPAYNASHGCLRIPIPDAIRVFSWISLGDAIYVDA